MNPQSNQDEDNPDQQQQESSTNQRPNRSELIKKIYYPDTLYPDGYTFFADRRSSQLQAMNTNTPQPQQATTTDSQESSRNIPKIVVNEIEMTDRENKSSSPMLDQERTESESDRRRFDVKWLVPSALRAPDKSQPPTVLLDTRFYTMKKTAMTILCLLIIIMSNSVQLKHVLKQGSTQLFYNTQVALGIISVIMCAGIGVVLMYVIRIDINNQYKHHKLDYIDNCVICFLFILVIFNTFIASCS